MKTNGKKLRASVLAGVLAVALALTGTFAWRSMSQQTRNEILDERNPGGRVHDDFNGLKNKDIYVENFTDEEVGTPVFARIKLLEYMEIGEDAGVKRGDHNRQAVPLVSADIDTPSTWQVYNPTARNDPFREYWDLAFGGQTVYMPTFNKNKDSLSVDVNGTYGTYDETSGKFKEGFVPYKDYKAYELGDTRTDTEYYDADEDSNDEYLTTGVGGPLGNGGELDTNYSINADVEHVAVSTLKGLGIITMTEWVNAGMPVCNKWVYDDSPADQGGGWFYWPEPVWPQTATGLLLDKVTQRKTAGEKSYYAIEVVGQFATAGNWGDSTADDDDPAKGFYADGLSDRGKALLDQAANVVVGADGKWYLCEPEDNNLYREIKGDEGTFSGLMSAGMDTFIGTGDDRGDVKANATDIEIGGKNYGKYYLPATATEPFYRVNGADGKLGTETDTCFWPIGGAEFPSENVTTDPVTSVTVTETSGATQVKNGGTLSFTAAVETDLADKSVVWSVSGNKSAETTISDTGVLTVKGETENTTPLTVTATSRLDGRKSGSMTVEVVSERTNITISGPTQVHVASSVELTPTVTVEGTPVTNPDVTWTAVDEHGAAIIGVRISATAEKKGSLTVADDETLAGSKVYVTATYAPEGKPPVSATYEVEVLEKITAKVTMTPAAAVAGGKVDAGATVSAPFTLKVTDNQNAPMSGYTAAWSVTAREPTSTFAARAVDTGTKVTIDKNTGALSVGRRVPAGTEITVTCTVTYTAEGKERTASSSATLTVRGPASVEVIAPAAKVMQGADVVMKAQLKKSDGSAYPSDQVFWELSGATKAGTTIDEDTGVLTVAKDETLNTVLTITATSLVDTSKKTTKTVTVVPDWTKDTVTLNDIEFYVLYRDTANNKALLLSKNILEQRCMHPVNGTHWNASELRNYLNNQWLSGKTQINSFIQSTTIKTRTDYNSTTCENDTCKVFLLSQADVYGPHWVGETFNDNDTGANDYTVPGQQLTIPGGNWAATYNGSAVWWRLRSPRINSTSTAVVDPDGGLNAHSHSVTDGGVRPAFWVTTSLN